MKIYIVAVVLRACRKASQVDTFNQTFLLTVPRTLKIVVEEFLLSVYFLGIGLEFFDIFYVLSGSCGSFSLITKFL